MYQIPQNTLRYSRYIEINWYLKTYFQPYIDFVLDRLIGWNITVTHASTPICRLCNKPSLSNSLHWMHVEHVLCLQHTCACIFGLINVLFLRYIGKTIGDFHVPERNKLIKEQSVYGSYFFVTITSS